MDSLNEYQAEVQQDLDREEEFLALQGAYDDQKTNDRIMDEADLEANVY